MLLKVINIEDSQDDSYLLYRELTRYGYNVHMERVETGAQMESLLHIQEWDIIISDYILPQFSGIEALNIYKKYGLEIPFIIVSGKIGEDVAIDAMKAGAHDYILKSNMATLGTSIERELRDASIRREQKKTEAALKAAHNQMDKFLSVISSIVIGIDSDDRVFQWNPAAERILGLKQGDVMGRKIFDCAIPWDWPVINDCLTEFKGGYKQMNLDDLPYRRTDGGEGILGITLNPICHYGKGKLDYFIFGADITSRKNEVSQRLLSQKLEAIGQMAAGIAHEINTPMQYIGDNAVFLKNACQNINYFFGKVNEMLMLEENQTSKLSCQIKDLYRELGLQLLLQEAGMAIDETLEGIFKIKKLLAAMKSFSHPGGLPKEYADINEGIRVCLDLTKNEWKYSIDMETSFQTNLPLVYCSIDAINQVVINMILNSIDAIKENEQNIDRGKILIKTYSEQEQVKIRVSDNGTGIPAAIIDKIFDPFFTTKDVGKGSGQGLYIAHDIVVKKHQGRIQAESSPGKGTTFIVVLPINPY